MLKDHDRTYCVIHIAGREYRVRFSLNALRCLEDYKPLGTILETKYNEWSIDDVLHLVHAGMCSRRANAKAVNRRDFDHVRPTVQELGEIVDVQDLPLLRMEIMEAILKSLPDPTPEADKSKPVKAMHEGHERAVYVDVMRRPEREYWNSTKREIAERMDCYFEVNGMKESADLVQEFDDD